MTPTFTTRTGRAVLTLGVITGLTACTPTTDTTTSPTVASRSSGRRSSGASSTARSSSSAMAGSQTTTPDVVGSAVGGGVFSVRVEPGAGYGWYVAQIGAGRRSVDVWMYELSDQNVIDALVAAHDRGVAVRVILDAAYHGKEVNRGAYDRLRGADVPVSFSPAGYIFHIKASIIDGSVLDVATGNLVPKYYPNDRDAIVIDRDPAQVRAASATFAGDWAGGPPAGHTAAAAGLVWSPGATPAMVAFIASARHSIDFTSEELLDRDVIGALVADTHRGVACRIVMTKDSHWDAAFTTLQSAGCAVHVLPDRAGTTYEHEKQILTDTGTPLARALIGSQNASPTSLHRNRELSVVLPATATSAITTEEAAFTTDYNAAPAFSG